MMPMFLIATALVSLGPVTNGSNLTAMGRLSGQSATPKLSNLVGSLAQENTNASLSLANPCPPPPAGTGNSGTWTCTKAWSGYMVTSDTFDQVEGNWNVQCPGSGNGPGYFESTWIGIGGNNQSYLVQVGTTYAGDPDANIPFAYYPFWEYATGSTTTGSTYIDTYAPLSCTTSIAAHISKNSSNQWCTSITWGGTYNYTQCFSSSDQPSQTTAEWVDERPTCNGGYPWLYNFNYTSFSNAYAHSIYRGWHTIGGYPRDQIGMYYYSGGANGVYVNMAYPNNLPSGDTTFRDNFQKPGLGQDCTVTGQPYYDYQ